MPGSSIIRRRRLLLLLYKVAIPQRGSCGRLLPYLATVMGGCSHLSHTFYGRLLPCLVISFMGGCSHVWSFLYRRLHPYLVISSMGGCSHFKPFLLWEAAPTHLLDPTGIVSQGRLLPADHSCTSVMGAFFPNPLYDPGIMRSADSI